MAKLLSFLDFHWSGQEFRVCMTKDVEVPLDDEKTFTFKKNQRYWANFKSFGFRGGWNMDQVTVQCPNPFIINKEDVQYTTHMSFDMALDDEILYIPKNTRFKEVWY